MGAVAKNFETVVMGPVQLMLVFVALAAYTVAIGQLASGRGRLIAMSVAIAAVAGFAASSASWEAGLILIAFVPVGVALFVGATWAVWGLALWRGRRADRALRAERVPERRRAQGRRTGSPLSRLWARLRFI